MRRELDGALAAVATAVGVAAYIHPPPASAARGGDARQRRVRRSCAPRQARATTAAAAAGAGRSGTGAATADLGFLFVRSDVTQSDVEEFAVLRRPLLASRGAEHAKRRRSK